MDNLLESVLSRKTRHLDTDYQAVEESEKKKKTPIDIQLFSSCWITTMAGDGGHIDGQYLQVPL